MKKWETFSKDDLQKIVEQSISFREVADKCVILLQVAGQLLP